MTQHDVQDTRINAVIGDDETSSEDAIDKFFDHLHASLQLPCEVTGIEDFQWEEYYVIGPGDPSEWKRLRKKQPSYKDTYDLLAVQRQACSKWMMHPDEDLGGLVRRKSDGREFLLGLSEIEAVDKESVNYQLLDDYAVWYVNSR